MVFDKLKDIIVEQLDADEDAVTMNAAIQEDLGADSLDVVDLITTIEDEFDISIPAVDIVPDNFNSAKKIYALIERLEEE